jgi:hypothetical protein
MVAVAGVVTVGDGLTLTTIENGLPWHKDAVAVGVTIYSTDPTAALLGLVSG